MSLTRRTQVLPGPRHATRGLSLLPLLALSVCLLPVGCRGTRSAMQMDSDSRTPFFSFQVPVKHEGEETSIQTAAETSGNNQPIVQPLALQDTADDEPSRWSRWIGRLKTPKSIPLPRTDINEDGEVVELETAPGSVDDF